MKGTVNKAIILGRLGQDPDVRTTASGTVVANLSVATTEHGGKDPNGNVKEITEWHRCVAFGRTAEVISQYLNKGSQIYIEGRNQTRKWQDQNGQDRYSTEVIINEMQFIGGKPDNASAPRQQAAPQQQPQGGFAGQPGGQQQAPQQPQPGGIDEWEDYLPF